MSNIAKDKLGNVITEGDMIVYATRDGSNARLKVGIVKRIYDAEETTFSWSSGKYRPKPTKVKKLTVLVGDDEYSKNITLCKLDRVAVIKPANDSILRDHLSEYGKSVSDSQSGE